MTIIAVLIAVGLVLLFLETLLPGLIAGALGLFALVAAVVYAYLELGMKAGNTTLAIVGLLLTTGTVLWVKFFPDSPMARRFVSHSKVGKVGAEKPELLGQTGTAVTSLHPAGTALFGNQRADVITEGGFVEKGKAVRVIAVEGMRVVVRPLENV